jgi:actin-related protein
MNFVICDPTSSLRTQASRLVKTYEFPDGNTVPFGADRYRVPEIIFNPALAVTVRDCPPSSSLRAFHDGHGILFFGVYILALLTFCPFASSSSSPPIKKPIEDTTAVPVPQLVHRALGDVDPELRAGLAGSIILSGGSTLFGGFPDRFAQETGMLTPTVRITLAFFPNVLFFFFLLSSL